MAQRRRARPGARAPALEDTKVAGVMVLALLSVLAVAAWVANPLAALLLVPALHLWLWALVSDVRLPSAVRATIAAAGAVAPVLVVAYYGAAFGLGPGPALWMAVLLAGGGLGGLLGALGFALAAGCMSGALVVARWRARAELQSSGAPASVRGPVGHAGPGSLGATGSALRTGSALGERRTAPRRETALRR
jgi:hypothetical protein